MAEQYNNLANSLLAGSIDGSTNPITFQVSSGDGAKFPATANGPFRVTVCDTNGLNAEVMMCTTLSTDTMTCNRGAGCTNETPTPTLVAHAAGSIVSHDITSGAIKSIRSEIENEVISVIQVSPLVTPPSGLTLHDGIGGATLSTDVYGFTLDVPSAGGNNVIYCSTALPASTYTAVFGFRGGGINAGFTQCGPMITDGTKIITWRFTQSPSANDIYYWSTFSNPVTQFTTVSLNYWGMPGIFCKIVQDATHRTFYYGDWRRRAWLQCFQQTALTSLTENAAGFFVLTDNGTHAFCEGFHYGTS